MSVKIIDRYLIWQFVQLFLMSYVSLAGLYTVVDAFTNLDSFLAVAEKEGNLLWLMFRFYVFRWVEFFDLTSGLLALISAMFTITLFQSRNELTALMAAGISKRRVVTPVIITAIAISFLAAASREFVLPCYAKELSQTPDDLLGDVAQRFPPRYDNKTDIFMNGKYTIANERRIHKPEFRLPDDLNRYGSYLVAENAVYEPPEGERPGGYRFKGVKQPVGFTKKPSLVGKSGEAVILCPSDRKFRELLVLQADECFVISDVDFDQLAGGGAWRHVSTAQLIRTLRNQSVNYGAEVKVAIHARLVKPLLDINLLLLGLPLVLARGSRNIFLSVAICLALSMGFLLTVYGCQSLGNLVYISPHLAAWLPLIIFVPLAAAMSGPFSE